MATKSIDIPGVGAVTIYKRRGARNLRVSVTADGKIRVTMPTWLPFKAGEQFALSRADWLQQNQVPAPVVLRHGHQLGKAHRLHFEARASQTIATRISLTEVRVLHPSTMQPDHPEVQRKATAAGLRALKQEAQQLLPGRLKGLAGEHGFSFGAVDVKQLKSRWGSCNSMQDITLNIFLMQLPWHLIDYVLLHELTHTRVMQHGKPFWDELQKHLPNAKALRQEINTYQPLLMPYD